MAVQERWVAGAARCPARARLDQHDVAAAEFALANAESMAAEGDAPCEQVFEAAGLDAQGEDDAEMARRRAMAGLSSHLPDGHFQRVAEAPVGGQHGGRLEAAVHQAVLAARIVARPQRRPIGRRRSTPGSSRQWPSAMR